MISPLAMVLAFTWVGLIWNVLGFFLLVVSVMLIAIILVQDSKGAGLTSAFGAGPGGESLLGARMQKDVARYTAWIAGIFSVIVLAMGLLGNYEREHSSAAATGASTAPADAGATKSDAALPGATLPGGTLPVGTAPGSTGATPLIPAGPGASSSLPAPSPGTPATTPSAAPPAPPASPPPAPAAGTPTAPLEKGAAEKGAEKTTEKDAEKK